MKKNLLVFVLLTICAVAFLSGCGNTTPPTTYVPIYVFTSAPPTQAPTATPENTATIIPFPTDTPDITTPAPTATPSAVLTKMYVNLEAGEKLRVRASASTSGEILGYLTRNDVVLIVEENVVSGWHKIRTNDGTTAYCSAEYLTLTSSDAALSDLKKYSTAAPSPTPTPTIANATYIKVVVESTALRVRQTPSTTSQVLDSLKNGTIVRAELNAADGWHKVFLDNGLVGYVSADYAEVYVPATPTPVATPTPTATPVATPTATPEETVTPTPEATPTPTPAEPTPTPTPVEEPTPTPTPAEPTPTPTPVEEPTPTPTPVEPTPTPTPVEEPTPTPTPVEPTPTPTPTPENIES